MYDVFVCSATQNISLKAAFIHIRNSTVLPGTKMHCYSCGAAVYNQTPQQIAPSVLAPRTLDASGNPCVEQTTCAQWSTIVYNRF